MTRQQVPQRYDSGHDAEHHSSHDHGHGVSTDRIRPTLVEMRRLEGGEKQVPRTIGRMPERVSDRNHPENGVTREVVTSTPRELAREVERLSRANLHLQRALENRPPIEHVVGMLMLLMSCDAETAWQALARISQDTNRKVIDIAEAIAGSVSAGEGLTPDVATGLRLSMPDEQVPRTG